MPAPKIGDRVRVTFEGTVEAVYGTGNVYIDVDGADHLERRRFLAPAVGGFEMLAKRLQVGDVVDGEDAYRALPAGVILADVPGGTLVDTVVSLGAGKFITSRGASVNAGGGLHLPRRIVHIDGAA